MSAATCTRSRQLRVFRHAGSRDTLQGEHSFIIIVVIMVIIVVLLQLHHHHRTCQDRTR